MRSSILIFGALLALASGPTGAWAAVDAEQANGRPMTDSDMDAARSYSEGVGRQMLKDELGVDLQSMRLEFDPETLSIENVGVPQHSSAAGGSGPGASQLSGPGNPQSFSLSLDQSGDLTRLGRDARDIPFGLSLKGQVPILARLLDMKTEVWVPFSWRDETKASASVPLSKLGMGTTEHFLESLGLLDKWDLRSDYSTRLGFNQVDAGLGTQWATQFTGLMDLDYDYSLHYGQGSDETIHWLKLKKAF
jgi:hypothetical protein